MSCLETPHTRVVCCKDGNARDDAGGRGIRARRAGNVGAASGRAFPLGHQHGRLCQVGPAGGVQPRQRSGRRASAISE